MTETELLQAMRAYFEALFPKDCVACGRRYETLREYVAATTPVGRFISYDLDLGDGAPEQPIGSFALANCACGSTLSLSTQGMHGDMRLRLLSWVKGEAEDRAISPAELVDQLRLRLRDQLLAESRADPDLE